VPQGKKANTNKKRDFADSSDEEDEYDEGGDDNLKDDIEKDESTHGAAMST
jgi:hypothetical protein